MSPTTGTMAQWKVVDSNDAVYYLENRLQAFVKAGRLLSEEDIDAVDIYVPYGQFCCSLVKEA